MDPCDDFRSAASKNARDGNVIKHGYDPQPMNCAGLTKSGKTAIAALKKKNAKRTGISNLKVGYNKVFGYYIEIFARGNRQKCHRALSEANAGDRGTLCHTVNSRNTNTKADRGRKNRRTRKCCCTPNCARRSEPRSCASRKPLPFSLSPTFTRLWRKPLPPIITAVRVFMTAPASRSPMDATRASSCCNLRNGSSPTTRISTSKTTRS